MQIRLRQETIQSEIPQLFPLKHLIASTSVYLCTPISLFEVTFHALVAPIRYHVHSCAKWDQQKMHANTNP